LANDLLQVLFPSLRMPRDGGSLCLMATSGGALCARWAADDGGTATPSPYIACNGAPILVGLFTTPACLVLVECAYDAPRGVPRRACLCPARPHGSQAGAARLVAHTAVGHDRLPATQRAHFPVEIVWAGAWATSSGLLIAALGRDAV